MAQQTPTTPTRIIRRPEVQARTGLSKSRIYDLMNPESEAGFDPTFPKQISIGQRAVGWVEAEIEAWIGSRIAESRQLPRNTSPKRRGNRVRESRQS